MQEVTKTLSSGINLLSEDECDSASGDVLSDAPEPSSVDEAITQFMPRRSHPSPQREEAVPLAQKIRGWLQESGNYTNTQTMAGMDFVLQGTYPRPQPNVNQLGFFVLKPSTENVVAIVANVGFSPEHRAAIAARNPEERTRFLIELQIDLNKMVGYKLQTDDRTHETTGVQLSEEIYFDEIVARKDVYDAIARVYRAYVHVSLRLSELPATAYTAP